MKKRVIFTVLVFLITLFLVSESNAQRRPRMSGSGGWGPGNQYGRLYNPQTVETIFGAVAKVEKMIPIRGMVYGIHLIVKTDTEEISVHLGPGWFIENQDVEIKPGDTIEVTGSRIVYQGNPAVIAALVLKGEHMLMLRDELGFPVWSGWKRGRRRVDTI